jgi:phosphoribosylaminoimidazole-succinocarboxamide synthase
VRRWLGSQGYTGDGPVPPIPDDVRIEAAARYIAACDTIRGESFVPNQDEPQARLRKNLGL